jgi:phospholipid/cholesterol/gamma-HCH transport system substrate-binding protein
MMGRKRIETLVGLFVLLGFVAIGYLALKAANLTTFNVGATYSITAKFDNVGGLKKHAPVRSAGVRVGRVSSIGFDNNTFQGVATLDIENQYQFPKDTSAKILTAGLLGDQYVGLQPGGDDKNLAQGDSIKMTQSAVVLENLLGQMLYNKAADGGEAKK